MVPKFRGKTIKGLLVVGYVSVVTDKRAGVEPGTYISNSVGLPFAYEVDPKTVGQSTGLKDKNGVEIFGGDCFAKSFQMIEIPTGRTFLKDEIGVVKFIDGQFVCHIDGWGSEPLKDVLGYQNTNDDHWKDGLVIGNIWENPELLEQANEN